MCLDIHMFTYFCLHMCLTDCGWSDMAWQMMSLPPWGGISLIWSKNHFLQYVYFCISQKKHFFKIMNFVGIASHIKCTFFFWLLYIFSCTHALYLSTFWYFYIFLSGNAWNRLWMKRYGMPDQPPHIWLKVTVTFLSGGHHPQDLT